MADHQQGQVAGQVVMMVGLRAAYVDVVGIEATGRRHRMISPCSPARAEVGHHGMRLGVVELLLQPARLGVPDRPAPGRRTTLNTASTISGTVISQRRFVGMLVNVVVARLAGERHEPHAEHVERRDARP